jgi:hypothetical protein
MMESYDVMEPDINDLTGKKRSSSEDDSSHDEEIRRITTMRKMWMKMRPITFVRIWIQCAFFIESTTFV